MSRAGLLDAGGPVDAAGGDVRPADRSAGSVVGIDEEPRAVASGPVRQSSAVDANWSGSRLRRS